jgi:hypothetical protein
MHVEHGGSESRRILAALAAFGPVLALKLYRLPLEGPVTAPTIPCLDHEAQLHESVAPHLAVYIQEMASSDLHELAFFPSLRRIEIDTSSTIDEHSVESDHRLLQAMASALPDYQVRVHRPSWWRGDRRVAAACRAQLTLRDALLGDDFERLQRQIDRLQLIGSLMEKHSRVASWGVRTLTGPVLAAVAFLAYQLLGAFADQLGEGTVSQLRYGLVGLLGAIFLYYGMKAVQLTGMANRVWKRSAEYALILDGRRRMRVER